MSVGQYTCFEVQYGVGSDTANGGGFDPQASSSMATDLSATLATGVSPVVSSGSYTFVSGDVGALLYVASGTNWVPGWYPIASVSGGSATLSASVGAVTLHLGNGPSTLNSIAGCATTASPTGGKWSVDYSVLATPRISYTDMVIGASDSTTYTSSANPVGPNLVGNIISITSGTGFTVKYAEVTSVSGSIASCDSSLGTVSSTGGHGGLGGCLNTPGIPYTIAGSGIVGVTYIKNTSSIAVSSALQVAGTVVGYSSNRWPGNMDTKPSINAAADSISLFTINNNGCVRNLAFTNTSAHSGITAISASHYDCFIHDCTVDSFDIGISVSSGGATISNCYVSNPNASGFGIKCVSTTEVIVIAGVEVRGNSNASVTGIQLASMTMLKDFIISGVTGVGLVFNGDSATAHNGTIYGCGSHGVTVSTHYSPTLFNVYCEGNGGYGFYGTGIGYVHRLINCSGYNNTSGNFTSDFSGSPYSIQGFVACSASALNTPGSYDFSLNNSAGGGALLRAAGFPTVYPGGSTSNYADIGAAQHMDSGGGGGGGGATTPIMRYMGS